MGARGGARSTSCALLLALCALLAHTAFATCPWKQVVEKLSAAGAETASAPGDSSGAHRKLAQAADWAPYPGDPSKKDWASVVSACKALTTQEKRFCSYFVRSAFHDQLTIHPDAWDTRHGADDSLLLNVTELARPESAGEDFALLAGRSAVRIARWFDVSVADTIAVCGAACVTELKGPDVLSQAKLRVGRLDNRAAWPPARLLASSASTSEWAALLTDRGLTVGEGVALMGSHALLSSQQCFRGANGPKDFCDPTKEPCTEVRMFNFAGERYFTDLCTPKLSMVPATDVSSDKGSRIKDMSAHAYELARSSEVCSWSSAEMRRSAMANLAKIRAGKGKEEALDKQGVTPVWWSSPALCSDESLPDSVQRNCPHTRTWMYTANDAWLGSACQEHEPADATHAAVQKKMKKYTSKTAWRKAFSKAYAKLVDVGAKWATPDGVTITGTECQSGFLDPRSPGADCSGCEAPGNSCAHGCICRTAFRYGWAAKAEASGAALSKARRAPGVSNPTPMQLILATQEALSNDPLAGDPAGDEEDAADGPVHAEQLIDPDIPNPNIPGATPGPSWNPLVSPYIPSAADRATFCTPPADTISVVYSIGGFPGSPFRIVPFTQPFKNPDTAVPSGRACRPDAHCILAYDIHVKSAAVDAFKSTIPACNGVLTNFLSYNGSIPGPTIIGPVGHEVTVQFRNEIGSPWQLGQAPCTPPARPFGRPISIHLHGSATLAPWDGWAEDETCSTEEKTYVYPNNRPTTGWYHDHALHLTAENAYMGLAGLYLMSDKKEHGSCGAPWGLDGMEELNIVLANKVINSQCQLFLDTARVHHVNGYGDLTLVSGVPWPVMSLQPKWYHLRLLNTGISRPYLIKLKNSTGHDVGPTLCKVIAGDGGYSIDAKPFPLGGLLIAVAERYEVVCDLSQVPGQTLYLWNGRNSVLMKDVPYFCFSHLIAKMDVAAALPPGAPAPAVFEPANPPPHPLLSISAVLSQQDYDNALALMRANQPHRTFVFGRRNGLWVINGETWDTFKIAAADVGQNTWELWELQTGSGWFHPIHVHLVDFFLLFRGGISAPATDVSVDGVFSYEQLTPKDVIFLGPGQRLFLIARYGPHRGDYMFHCHNLIHEDGDMMRAFHITQTGLTSAQTALPIQTAAAGLVLYDNYANPMFNGTAASVPAAPIIVDDSFAAKQLSLNAYEIFYPLPGQLPFSDATQNPWLVQWCPLTPPPVVG